MKFPLSLKIPIFIVGLVAFIFMLHIGKGIILPIIFAVLIAIILHPFVNLITRFKIHRIVAISITLLLSLIVIAGFGTFLYSQFISLSDSLPQFIEKGTLIFNESNEWATSSFDLSPEKINEWIDKLKGNVINNSGEKIGRTIINLGSLLGALFLIPVYVFLLLFYQPLLIEFIRRLFGKDNLPEVNKIISQVKTLIQSYLVGLSIQVAIIATLYTIGLLFLGIQYALVLAILGALLNLIPYLGAILAAMMPMFVAFATKSSQWSIFFVLGLYIIVQAIDNNFIVPKVVASKVKINVLVSIFVVIAFGSLWGIAGMFLSIPLTAIIKLIFDHIEPLKPWGFLLGDTMPPELKFKSLLKINPIIIKKKKKGI